MRRPWPTGVFALITNKIIPLIVNFPRAFVSLCQMVGLPACRVSVSILLLREPDVAVGMETRLRGSMIPGSNLCQGKDPFPETAIPATQSHLRLIPEVCHRDKALEREAHHIHPSGVEVKNEWWYITIPPI